MNTSVQQRHHDHRPRPHRRTRPPPEQPGAAAACAKSREELQQNFKSVLQTGLGKLDLVTREEFDVQRAVLLRTRDKLDELQRAVAQIEAQLAARSSPAALSPPPWDLRSCTAVHAPACTRPPSGSKCTCPAACRGCRSSACRRPRCAKPRIACARRSSARSSNFPRASSPSTSRPPTCPRTAAASTWRSRSASSPPAGRFRSTRCSDYEFLGELGLTGELRAIDGVLPAALAARARPGASWSCRSAMAPRRRWRARSRPAPRARCWKSARALEGRKAVAGGDRAADATRMRGPDMCDVRGQAHARRALEVAAAGGHHLLLIGPPGCGKTLLASRLTGLLPEASEAEALEAAAIASVSGRGLDPARWRERPVSQRRITPRARSRWSAAASQPRPGEISLAHNGVLFLDELPEWDRRALEVLREPLESGVVTISRAARQSEFPARFQLVAAMNPCPCGWAGDPSARCRCNADAIQRYRGRISGPLLDRIDLHVDVPRLPPAELRPDAPDGETSDACARASPPRARVQHARAGKANAQLGQARNDGELPPGPHDQMLLERAIDALQLSRALDAPHPARRAHDRRPRRQRPTSARRISAKRWVTGASTAAWRHWPREPRKPSEPRRALTGRCVDAC